VKETKSWRSIGVLGNRTEGPAFSSMTPAYQRGTRA